MAQSVHVTIDYDPEKEGLAAGAVNKLLRFEPSDDAAKDVPDPSREGHLSVQVTVPRFTSEAIVSVLSDLEKTGIRLDGPLTIHVEKLHQIGGSDGASYFWHMPSGNSNN